MIIFLREKFIAQIFMWIIAVVFIIGTIMLYGGSGGQQNSGTDGEVVLKIDTLEVTRGIFEDRISQVMRQRQNQRFGIEPDRKEIQKQLINGFITRTIEGSANITDAEVMHYIRSDENRVSTYNQLGPELVVDFYKFQLSSESLRESINNLELVTDTEAEHAYQLETREAKVNFIEFRHIDYNLKKYEAEAEAEAKQYYQENQDDYMTEEQVNIRYINVNPKHFVTQAAIEEYYTDNQNLYMNSELVKARHILKKFPDDATDEQKTETKAAAEELLKTVKEELAAGTTFADLAEKHSEDTGSAVDGGSLGTSYDHLPEGKYFGRGQMVKPFEEACFDVLQPGEVSDLVESRFGYHIIQLEEKHPPLVTPFPEVESEISDKLVQIDGVDGAEAVAKELIFEIEFADFETAIGLDKYKDLSLESGETGFFSKDGSDIPQVISSSLYRGLLEEVFDMEVGVTKTIETKEGYTSNVSAIFVVSVLGKKPPGIPEFDSVKAQVIDDIKGKMSRERASEDAQQLLNARVEGESLEDLSKKYKAPEGTSITEKTVQESNLFNLMAGSTYSNYSGSTYISGMGNSKDVLFAAFTMSVGDVSGPFSSDTSTYIIELVERVEPDLNLYQTDPTQRVKQFKTLLDSKKTSAYENWLGARKKALVANVWIHEDYR